jgi:hypothetical protein
MPIVTCKGRNRTAKIARECVDKGFCSTKNMYYYGLKLHLPAFRRKGTIPFSNKIYFSAASEGDLSVVEELNWLDDLYDTEVFADKTYIDKQYFKPRKQWLQLELLRLLKLLKVRLNLLNSVISPIIIFFLMPFLKSVLLMGLDCTASVNSLLIACLLLFYPSFALIIVFCCFLFLGDD